MNRSHSRPDYELSPDPEAEVEAARKFRPRTSRDHSILATVRRSSSFKQKRGGASGPVIRLRREDTKNPES